MLGLKEKLKEFMDIFGDSTMELAKAIGITYQSMNKKINGHSDFKLGEIKKIKNRYNLTAEEIYYIFFYNEDDTDDMIED